MTMPACQWEGFRSFGVRMTGGRMAPLSGLSHAHANASVRGSTRGPYMINDFEILVNGATRSVPDGTTIAALLRSLGVDRGRVAVERNQDVVPRASYDEVTLAAGDRIEVVAFVGGG